MSTETAFTLSPTATARIRELAAAGQALFGDDWYGAMARALGATEAEVERVAGAEQDVEERGAIAVARRDVAGPRDPARRRRVLDAAKRHFTLYGLKGTRLDAVAADAGCAKGALYLEFADKEALLIEVVSRGTTEEFSSQRRRQHQAYQ